MKRSLSYQVLIAVIFGIFIGLFFGPLAKVLEPIGTAYTMLLQMTVLPYICFSLLHGLGSMTPGVGKRLFKCGWPYLVTLWVVIFLIIYLLIQLVPDAISPLVKTNGTGGLSSGFSKNFLTYLIPENPIYDVVNNIVPAIAIFGLIGGIALMHIEKKEPLIGTLERINQVIEKILHWLGVLSPIAAFAYISVAFGTIHFEDLPKIEVYLVSFVLTSLFVTFWILPTLISCLTPISFKEASAAIRFICLLPFVTGLSTAALPFLNDYLKQLSHKHQVHEQFRKTSQTVLPIAYSFGNIGNATSLFLIFFLGFYFRHSFSGLEKLLLFILTFPMSIGTSTSSLNSTLFLIQQLELPQSAIAFFLELKAVTYNFQVMMSVGGVLTLIILTLYSYYGLLQIKWTALCLRLTLSLVAVALTIFASSSVIHLQDNYENLYMSHKISDVIPNPEAPELVASGIPRADAEDPLKEIVSTRTLRVGFNANSVPYCYYNGQHEIVGYDIAYAYQLARDLNCKLELVPFAFENLIPNIQDSVFDIGMSSILMTEERILQIDFTTPYKQDKHVLIVPATKKKEFLHLQDISQITGLKIGAGGAQIRIAERLFPHAKIIVSYGTDLLVDGTVDTIFWSESSAFVWCLSHPEYVVIEYGDLLGSSYFSYPIHQNASDFRFFLDNWLSLKEQSGFKKAMESYWIDGISPKKTVPRWSVLRNVLHLID